MSKQAYRIWQCNAANTSYLSHETRACPGFTLMMYKSANPDLVGEVKGRAKR